MTESPFRRPKKPQKTFPREQDLLYCLCKRKEGVYRAKLH